MHKRELSPLHEDALRELGNICTGHAATALSKLLDCRVDCSLPRLFVVPIGEVQDVLGNPDEVSVGIFQKLHGKFQGSILLLFTREAAFQMINLLLNRGKEQVSLFGTLEKSALEEIGNILSGSYVTALSQLTNLFALPSVPNCIIDLTGAILQAASLDQMGEDGEAVIVETLISVEKQDFTGKILFFPVGSATKDLLEGMGLVEGS